jgi:hypothetical protein
LRSSRYGCTSAVLPERRAVSRRMLCSAEEVLDDDSEDVAGETAMRFVSRMDGE